ncbi:DUF817 domain-containing protein [Sphingomonas sp. ASV193]|uniref:DUF817 domain-containing protein n=1 Tax=Sphingomonas sp. ASV193 TaxID=3144405 RepID=UPI0032E8FD79
MREALEQRHVRAGAPHLLFEFALFVFKQGWACLFGALMLGALLLTHFWWPAGAPIARYDALTLWALAVQGTLLATRLETWREASVILIFHLVGTAMELFKTAHGSWTYPEPSLLRIGGVPLFSGFMYASVGSYIARVWRGFDFRFVGYPRRRWSVLLAAAIYANFFTHHWLPDVRVLLFALISLLYWRTRVMFRTLDRYRAMPLLLGWLLVSLFIWLAENIGTFANAWRYPAQAGGWHLVPIGKLGAWYLLMYISFVLVSLVSPPRAPTCIPARLGGGSRTN